MKYKIDYNYLLNKEIICIYPLAEKDLLKNFGNDKVVVCVSNDPKYSVEYYNLPNGSIIYCSFYNIYKKLKVDVFDLLKEKKIKMICACSKINNINLIGNIHSVNKNVNLSNYDVSIINDKAVNLIDLELKTVNYRYQPTTGFIMMMDVISQCPKKIYIFGYSFFIKNLVPKSNYKSITDTVTHSYKKEYKILKKYFEKDNVIKDDILNYVMLHENEIPGRD
tara:strand:+ start:1505 stop:2170 length:666 start_codon:yes stop_codon:yes gene_type:complete